MLCVGMGGDDVICKYCDKCHKRIRIGEKCGCRYKHDHKVCIDDDFYKSVEWRNARSKCIELCCGLDLYSLSMGKIEFGYTVHHIEPLDIMPRLALVQTNLIYLTESNHRIIHELYKKGHYGELTTQLKRIKREFIQGGMSGTFLKNTKGTSRSFHFAKF